MSLPIFLPCAAGVEPLLAAEVSRLLPEARVQAGRGGVALEGREREVMLLNLESRLAQRVLVEVAVGRYRHEDDIHALASSVDWTLWMTPRETLRVDVTAQRSPLRSLNFAALRVKDGVCDMLREATGARPSVDTHRPDIPLHLHLTEDEAILYVDTSGEPLFKRGWRDDVGEAPLKETLAAAMLAAAGWQGTADTGGALHDPVCGSGTIVIEAAQIACRVAPGLQRRFAFERQAPFEHAEARRTWAELQDVARARIRRSEVPIVGSDVAFRMVDFARRNAARAGVADAITFHGGDALERPAPTLPAGMPGTLMLNPPYGERIATRGSAAPDDFFPRLAAHWKRAYAREEPLWTAWVLSPDMKLPTAMRLKESRRIPMWNGPIECRLFRFDLVKGGMRERKPGDVSSPD